MRLAIIGFSVALFLVAAKTHGRQLRLEREKAGYATVNFGGENPPFIEALWNAERWRFWPLTIALAGLAALLLLRQPGLLMVLAVASWSPSLSFFVTGLLSARRAQLLGQNLIWYGITVAVAAALAVCVLKK